MPLQQHKQAIENALEELRPTLKKDGGDCELVCIEENKVIVRMTGNCVQCQLATLTVHGIQKKLIEQVGVPLRVIPVPPGH
ncbi:NifU family protein [Zymomonas mobilis]|uniref:Nitrogen-fixing NifU domain protein n=1 Tax=Zymomonas mobilis subsp. pomaceae (strain ATCC 29192 / DSM 22645 / JCM 10191 / CCUG 17912 / NBRC 13757 / NCIMB 11200 / NRRL B-4491 / Barker I) TaxID=579138 RepID=F8EUP6_ZYMMT|nr:NifU family protein [Zymomonas mobilis]AEI38192.1 nitrogen-fixing NifU domain protein [Zymomonas mobilis subsp. pomaceae ATCC 29192]MDX5947882.1 NifU family protein [Zymomonas mobilis subsp. pomaceae]GEB89954.1 hypothetical protein ZMO02_15910 [Zymomonas mobilis subsp. pomaceae]